MVRWTDQEANVPGNDALVSLVSVRGGRVAITSAVKKVLLEAVLSLRGEFRVPHVKPLVPAVDVQAALTILLGLDNNTWPVGTRRQEALRIMKVACSESTWRRDPEIEFMSILSSRLRPEPQPFFYDVITSRTEVLIVDRVISRVTTIQTVVPNDDSLFYFLQHDFGAHRSVTVMKLFGDADITGPYYVYEGQNTALIKILFQGLTEPPWTFGLRMDIEGGVPSGRMAYTDVGGRDRATLDFQFTFEGESPTEAFPVEGELPRWMLATDKELLPRQSIYSLHFEQTQPRKRYGLAWDF